MEATKYSHQHFLQVYQYSDQMLKHLPTGALKTLQKTLLFSKKPVYFASASYDRRNSNSKYRLTYTGLNTEEQTTKKKQHVKDLNIDDRIDLVHDQIEDEFMYRIPLRYFSDIGKINFPTKIDYRIKLFLETDMDQLFESRKFLSATADIPEVDAEIIFSRASFIQYEHILLDKNFRQHLETIMVSKKILRMGAQKTPIQKTYEIQTGSDTLNVEFLGSNKQFDWIEISVVPDIEKWQLS